MPTEADSTSFGKNRNFNFMKKVLLLPWWMTSVKLYKNNIDNFDVCIGKLNEKALSVKYVIGISLGALVALKEIKNIKGKVKKLTARFWLPQNRSVFLIPTMFLLVVSLYHLLELFLSENESSCHCLAEPRQPRKKNTPCFLDLAGVKVFLKEERTFFFGVLPSRSRAGGGTMRTKFWQNYFLGKGFAKTSAHLFLNSDVANGKGRSAMRKSQAVLYIVLYFNMFQTMFTICLRRQTSAWLLDLPSDIFRLKYARALSLPILDICESAILWKAQLSRRLPLLLFT